MIFIFHSCHCRGFNKKRATGWSASAHSSEGTSKLSRQTSCATMLNPRIYSLRLSGPYISPEDRGLPRHTNSKPTDCTDKQIPQPMFAIYGRIHTNTTDLQMQDAVACPNQPCLSHKYTQHSQYVKLICYTFFLYDIQNGMYTW